MIRNTRSRRFCLSTGPEKRESQSGDRCRPQHAADRFLRFRRAATLTAPQIDLAI